MKRIFLSLIILICLQGFGQIDKAIDDKITVAINKIPSGGKVDSLLKLLTYDTTLQRTFNSASNVDTLLAPLNKTYVYELVVCGDASLVRVIAVTNKNGVYSSRFSDALQWAGATGSKLNSATINNRVIVSTVGITGNYIYQRQRKNL